MIRMRYFLIGTILITGTSLVLAQRQNTTGSSQLTTLIVSPNANGVGVRVVDQTITPTGQVEASNGQQVGDGNDDDDMDDQVVAGLLEWLDKKKKKKRDKKRKDKDKEKEKDKGGNGEGEKNNEKPTERPAEEVKPVQEEEEEKPPKEQQQEEKEKEKKKEIHIHIHIKNKDSNNNKKHDHKQDKHSGYEDYHEGHYDHDKHYHGKHSWPLLGHHFNWDHDSMSGGFGGGGGGSGGHYGDDFGFEAKKLNNYAIEKKPIVVQRPMLVKKKNGN